MILYVGGYQPIKINCVVKVGGYIPPSPQCSAPIYRYTYIVPSQFKYNLHS